MNLTLNEILILLVIGVLAGMISGFIGVGGGIVIVPADTVKPPLNVCNPVNVFVVPFEA